LAIAGWHVHVAYLTVAGFSSQHTGRPSSHEERRSEAEAARRVLGVVSHDVLFPDGEFHLLMDRVPSKEIVAFIERQIHNLSPKLLLSPADGHFHQDHRATSSACIAALRVGSRAAQSIDTALAYGPSHLWWGGTSSFESPDVFVDISQTVETKLQALACYRSQVDDFPHPRSLDAVRAYARACGASVGLHYAEPYAGLRTVIR
jgi:LmbE family N-acetylglucosaminyl deacetylase